MVGCHTRKFFKIDFWKKVMEKRLFWGVDKGPNRCIFLWKLKTFRFSSIEFFRSVVWLFWSYKKIALGLKTIPDVYKVYLGCLECSPDLGLSFCNFRIVIWHSRRILSTENENFSIFTKRYTDLAFCQPPQNSLFSMTFFQKSILKKFLVGQPNV